MSLANFKIFQAWYSPYWHARNTVKPWQTKPNHVIGKRWRVFLTNDHFSTSRAFYYRVIVICFREASSDVWSKNSSCT